MVVRFRFACVVFVLLVCSAQVAQGQAVKHALTLKYCRALFWGDPKYVPEEIRKQVSAEQRQARNYFGAKLSADMAKSLTLQRNMLHRSSFSYSSVTYVLAYYGVDVLGNSKRMLYAFDSHYWKSIPERERKWPNNKLRPDETGDMLVPAIMRIYARHPSDELWVATLNAHDRSGSASEAPGIYFVIAFKRYSQSFIRALARMSNYRENYLHGWAGQMAFADYDPKDLKSAGHPKHTVVRALLLKMTHSSDPMVAPTAKKLWKAFLSEVKDK